MKALLVSLLLFASGVFITFGADITNGVFYVDSPTECHLISQNGGIITNRLVAGKTYTGGDEIMEMNITNRTTLYFPGGLIIEAGDQSVLSINILYQEINNIDAMPRKVEVGSHNIDLMFSKGEFCVIYPNVHNYSSLTINSPYTTYQLDGGKYYFRVSDKSAIAYVLEGALQVDGDKKTSDKTEKGKVAVAIPFNDINSGMSDKIITSVKAPKPEETDRFTMPVLTVDKKQNGVQFFVIDGKVVGVWMK